MLDFAGDASALGKNVGDDLREGKATLPVLFAYARGDEAARAFWRRCIEQGEVSDDDVMEAAERVEATGALDDARSRARQFADRAVADLSDLPETEMRANLEDVVGFAVSRLH